MEAWAPALPGISSRPFPLPTPIPITPWGRLLPELLFRVFGHLSDTDRCSARLVCRSWDKAFRNPDLWRSKRTFRVCGRNAVEVRRSCLFLAGELGEHLQHMELLIGEEDPTRGSLAYDYRVALDVALFLKTACSQGMHLKTLIVMEQGRSKLPRIRASTKPLDPYSQRMHAALCAFLEKQNSLEVFHISSGHIGGSDAIRVLESLHSECLTVLGVDFSLSNDINVCYPLVQAITGAVYSTGGRMHKRVGRTGGCLPKGINVPAYLDVMGKFKALQEIVMNFVWLGDAVLFQMVSSSASLRSIRLGVDAFHWGQILRMADDNLLVTESGWRAAADVLENLRVTLCIRAVFTLSDLCLVLVPGMPLAKISVCIANEIVPRVHSLTEYLALHYSKYLVQCELSWYHTTFPHGSHLARMVNGCGCLQCLRLIIALPHNLAMNIDIKPRHLPDSDVIDDADNADITVAWSNR